MKKNILVYLLLLCSISIFAQVPVEPPRTCTVCKETKAASEFSGDSKTCKACVKKKSETRICSSCKKTKALNAFSGNSKVCKECATPKSRTCSVCHQSKPVANFSRNSNECEECKQIRIAREEEDRKSYTDLGLPSGTLWANRNVGASSPEDYGDYFAWGETQGYKSGKRDFSWKTYKWCNGDYDKLTKYCVKSKHGNNGFTDNKTELDIEDDAAYVNWGEKWRMPSYKQLDELEKECTWTETTYNGTKGYSIKGPNGNSIFLPFAGYFEGNEHFGGFGSLDAWGVWSSQCYEEWQYDAGCKSYDALGILHDVEHRCYGFSIRPVRVTPQKEAAEKALKYINGERTYGNHKNAYEWAQKADPATRAKVIQRLKDFGYPIP